MYSVLTYKTYRSEDEFERRDCYYCADDQTYERVYDVQACVTDDYS